MRGRNVVLSALLCLAAFECLGVGIQQDIPPVDIEGQDVEGEPAVCAEELLLGNVAGSTVNVVYSWQEGDEVRHQVIEISSDGEIAIEPAYCHSWLTVFTGEDKQSQTPVDPTAVYEVIWSDDKKKYVIQKN